RVVGDPSGAVLHVDDRRVEARALDRFRQPLRTSDLGVGTRHIEPHGVLSLGRHPVDIARIRNRRVEPPVAIATPTHGLLAAACRNALLAGSLLALLPEAGAPLRTGGFL